MEKSNVCGPPSHSGGPRIGRALCDERLRRSQTSDHASAGPRAHHDQRRDAHGISLRSAGGSWRLRIRVRHHARPVPGARCRDAPAYRHSQRGPRLHGLYGAPAQHDLYAGPRLRLLPRRGAHGAPPKGSMGRPTHARPRVSTARSPDPRCHRSSPVFWRAEA